MNQCVAHSITDLRLLLRDKIYSNNVYIDLLLENIKNQFDCTSITINCDMSINIKIKKTAMKKAEDFTHSVKYYYPLIENAFASFLYDARIQNELIAHDNTGRPNYTIYESISHNILSLFNATVLCDNIIIINL